MNHTITRFHKSRFEWAFQAKKEFINRFVRLDVDKAESSSIKELTISVYGPTQVGAKHWIPNLEMNELSFNQLTKLYKEAVAASKQELDKNASEIEKYTEFIKRQEIMVNHESNEANSLYGHLVNNLSNYEKFSEHLVKIFKNVDPTCIQELVSDHIEYNLSNKKASVINGYASNLQLSVETDLKIHLREVSEDAKNLKISSGYLLQLPERSSIPKVHQKIDAFWFKGTYEKALYWTRGEACDWVEEMYKSYNHLLRPVLTEVGEKIGQLRKEAEAFQHVTDEKMKKLAKELAEFQEIKNNLEAQHHEIHEMWKQDRAHVRELQSYFIKHWLQYKEELQQHFLYGNAEERWLAAQYLQLLQQDGRKIIESLNDEV